MKANFVFMCGFHRSNAIVAHQGLWYHERCLGRHAVTARQDESGYSYQMELCLCNSCIGVYLATCVTQHT